MRKFIALFFLIFVIQGICISQNPDIDRLRLNLERAVTDSIRVDCFNSIASYYIFKRLDSSLLYSNKALDLARKINYPRGEVDALGRMSLANSFFGNKSQALQICLEAINIADKNNLISNKSFLLVQLGNVLTDSKNFSKAIDTYRQSIALQNSLSIGTGLAEVRMSEAYLLMNEPDSALYYCQTVYDRGQNQGNSHALILYVMGKIHDKLGHTDLALNFLNRSKFISNGGGYEFDINFAIAQIYKRINQVDSSSFYANKSLEIAKETGFYSYLIDAGELLSEIYEFSDPHKALQYSRMTNAYSDSLHTMVKLASMGNLFDFDEQERQYELEAAKTNYNNRVQRLWIFSISGALFSVVVLVLILYRNNKNKQKANAVLKAQKEEVQSTLEKLKSTQSQLIQSEKMASLGELTAGIAHEIQNPLNFVNNFSEVNSELIRDLKSEIEKGNTDEVKAIVNDIESNSEKINNHGKRADGIVKSMLQHSRSSSGKKELTDINSLCDEYLRLAYHGYRAKDKNFNAQFETHFDPSLPKLNIVPQDIGRVVLNLINNAFYAVNERFKVRGSTFEPLVIVSTKKISPSGGGEGLVEISVKDNGPGIPDPIKEKIFQPFFTTKPTGQGTGLGLSLAYDIVKAHGGTIEVESMPNEGTKFIIKIQSI